MVSPLVCPGVTRFRADNLIPYQWNGAVVLDGNRLGGLHQHGIRNSNR
jgi:hypothetical protein